MTSRKTAKQKREWKVWVPAFVTSSFTDQSLQNDRLPVYKTRAIGDRHWAQVQRATLTLSSTKKDRRKEKNSE